MLDLILVVVFGILVVGVLIKYLSVVYIVKKDFVYVGWIFELYVWFVKLCGGLKVQVGQCEKMGFFYGGVGDR